MLLIPSFLKMNMEFLWKTPTEANTETILNKSTKILDELLAELPV